MDGNGRWAQRRGQARTAGHEAGSEALKRTIRAAIESGVSALTVYAFSSENWRRPQSEVRQLLELSLKALNREIRELDENNVKLVFIGNRKAFSRPLREGMARAERRTADNSGLLLNIAVSYGGQADIVAAAQSLDRKSTRLNSSHVAISYAVFCLKKRKKQEIQKDIEAKYRL